MITKDNLKQVLENLGFKNKNENYVKTINNYTLLIDYKNQSINYPKEIKIHDKTTSNFSHPENFVVFECVHRLLEKGYKAEHLELEPKWNLGRDKKGGKADILVKDNENNPYLIIECKTTDSKNSEFIKEWNRMQEDGGQLFSYFQQEKGVKYLCLYTSDFSDKLEYKNYIIQAYDNEEYLKEKELQNSYKKSNNNIELFKTWKESYELQYFKQGIFEANVNAYKILEITPTFDNLKELKEEGKYHEFAKILRNTYCDFRKFDKELYENFLNGSLDSKLVELEAFKDYRNAFEQTSDYKKLKESKIYKESKDKQALEDKAFLAYAQAIEKDKLLYFSLSLNQEVLIIKSPSDIKEQKKFLGYEWSNRKGDEGLKELHEPYLSPLFERGNPQNETKLNTLICKAFLKTLSDIPKDLQGYARKARLIDMMDFEKVEFNKAISLNPSNSMQSEMSNPFANSKYELVRLVEIENIKIQKGQNITQKLAKIGNIKVVAGGKDYAYFHNDFNRNENTITISASGANAGYVNFWKEKIFASDCTTINLPNLKVIQFIYYVLKCNQKYIMSLARGAAQPHVYPKDIENIKIPLPPLEIQKQIVAECEKVEEQYNTLSLSIKEYQNLIKAMLQKCGIIEDNQEYELNSILDKINNLCKINLDSEFLSSFNKTIKEYALSNPIFKLSIGKRVLNNELLENGQIPVYSANVLEVFGFVNKEILQDYDNDSVLWGIDGDWMVGFIPKNKKFYPTDHCGVLRVDDTKINAKYISFILNEAGKKQGFSRKLRASIDRIKALRVKLPSLEFQDQIADITDKIEKKINEYKIELDRLEEEKEKILQKYLFS
ncbi:TPA: restriction endonuclease subunit S [Campylobacter jejuni]|nr:restriction endonuclease subunit S [Campylobacter jejuni]HEH5298594.1 restriction endonuclease subunit S [Campylobacter jejuni]